MGFYHDCAVGFFEPSSLESGADLRVKRLLDRGEVDSLARAHLAAPAPSDTRPAMWWVDEAYVVVEYIALTQREDRVRFIRALMDRTGCDAVDVLDDRVVRERSWRQRKKLAGQE